MLLMLGLMLSGMAVAETTDDGTIVFEAQLTQILDLSASEWYESSEKRAYLTMLLILDMGLTDDTFFSRVSLGENSYVGKDGLNLAVYVHMTDGDGVMVYCPATGEASFVSMESNLTDLLAESVMASTCGDGYYKNDLEDLYEAALELQGLMESD